MRPLCKRTCSNVYQEHSSNLNYSTRNMFSQQKFSLWFTPWSPIPIIQSYKLCRPVDSFPNNNVRVTAGHKVSSDKIVINIQILPKYLQTSICVIWTYLESGTWRQIGASKAELQFHDGAKTPVHLPGTVLSQFKTIQCMVTPWFGSAEYVGFSF